MEQKGFNIAIDGPAGAGKSTIAKLAAARLGLVYVDTGAMYRAIALFMLERAIDPEDEAAVCMAVGGASIAICYEDGQQRVLLNGKDVSGRIRSEKVGNAASAISAYPMVRTHLLDLQRQLAARTDVIMDGRDIGTCILPEADVKIFLTASSRVRAMRRLRELMERGEKAELEEIEKDIIERDERDKNRATAPLRQAEGARFIDSSQMSIDEVVQEILNAAYEAGFKQEERKS